MKVIHQENNKYVIRFDKGEELVKELVGFCEASKIEAGWFWAIGAVAEITLSYYDLPNKKYIDKDFSEGMEIIGLMGNVAKLPAKGNESEKTIIHVHGNFSDREMKVVAGHIKKLIVGPTCELYLTVSSGRIEREYSEEIGLNLMK